MTILSQTKAQLNQERIRRGRRLSVVKLVSDFENRAGRNPIIDAKCPTAFMLAARCGERGCHRVEPADKLKVPHHLAVHSRRSIGELHVTALAVVTESKRTKAEGMGWIAG